MVLSPPTSQTFSTFAHLLGSSGPLQTPVCSEYHPFAQSRVVSNFSLTKLQQHGTNSPLLSVTHPLSVPSNLPRKLFSDSKTFFFSVPLPCPEVPVCQGVCLCAGVWVVCGCGWVCGCARAGACVCRLRILTFYVQIHVCVRFLSA